MKQVVKLTYDKAKPVLLDLLVSFLRVVLIVARQSALLIKMGVAYAYRGTYLKEELALATDKQFQCTISYYIIPLETCK